MYTTKSSTPSSPPVGMHPVRTALLLLIGLWVGSSLAAQDPSDAPVTDEPTAADSLQAAQALLQAPPPNFATAEIGRSRNCVPLLGRLEAVSAELDPRRARAERIGALHRAVSAEDSTRVTPLTEDDPLERAVGEWFRNDYALAFEYLATEDEAVREERQSRREAMLTRLSEALEEVNQEAQEILDSASGLQQAIRSCQGRLFIRSVVLEECQDVDASNNPLCEEARASEPTGRFQFVENPSDLWDIEQLRPWSEPARIRPTPTGGLAGARTAAVSRRGNLSLIVGLEPLFQLRDSLSEDQVEGLDAHLDSLGMDFDHPDFVMSPTLGFELDVPGRLGGETDYLLHFGDLSNPQEDVLQSIPVPERWPVGGAITPSEEALVRLVRGDPVSLTAVRMPEEGGEAEPVFSLGITTVQQSARVNSLLQYMMGGGLDDDLTSLVPPEEEQEGATDEAGDPGAGVPDAGDGDAGDPDGQG